MTKLDDINTRLRALLEDSSKTRFSDALVNTALRQALDEIESRFPLVKTTVFTIATSGRDQALTGVNDCRYIISLIKTSEDVISCELLPGTGFTYSLAEGTPTLHFPGRDVPTVGEQLAIQYAAGYTLEGLEGELTTTLPDSLNGALVDGAAALACLLRAGSLVGRYGSDPAESARLMGIGQLWRETFERTLNGLKVLQEFGFPPGFPLDRWDRTRK